MRAGLLSQPQVIQRINEQFVSVSLTHHELKKLAESGHELAREIFDHWKYPVTLAFLTPEGRFITSLSTLTDLTHVHPDTSRRPSQCNSIESDVHNTQVFLKHLAQHFPEPPPSDERKNDR